MIAGSRDHGGLVDVVVGGELVFVDSGGAEVFVDGCGWSGGGGCRGCAGGGCCGWLGAGGLKTPPVSVLSVDDGGAIGAADSDGRVPVVSSAMGLPN